MRTQVFLLFLLTSLIGQAQVPNVVADRYIPAATEQITGLLGYRMSVNLEKRLLHIDTATILSGVERRPGAQTWIGEHVGKFLFSAAHVYAYTHDPRLKQLMDAVARTYISCQEPDGYLGTYLLKDRWTEWDVWAHKYAIIGLLNYYEVTGYAPALEAARKAADLVCRTFGDGKRDLMTAGFHAGLAPGSILEPMVDLYRYTGDPRYLDFCRYILRAYEQPDGPKIISQLEATGNVTTIGDAKAYEMMSCFLGLLKYYKLTGDDRYLKALETAWSDIHSNRLYITGTASDHEVFRADHQLRAETKDDMGEGCVTVTWVQFNLQLLRITGDPKYAAELERSVYNHLLAAEDPQTGCVSYYTALQGPKPYRCDQGYSCCLSSVPRGISLIPDMVFGRIDGVLSVLLYEGGTVSDSGIRIDCASSFPDTGRLVYTIHPSGTGAFPLDFRVPEWSASFTAQVGSEVYHGVGGQFLRITRTWRDGDQVVVTFGMPVMLVTGGPTYSGRVAFQRGPQVMAVDLSLNPGLTTFAGLTYKGAGTLSDAADKLPPGWGWKQAYTAAFRSGGQSRDVVLVPFSEAGQQGGKLEVWVRGVRLP